MQLKMSFASNPIVLSDDNFLESLEAFDGLASLDEEAPFGKGTGCLLVVDDEPGPREALQIIFKGEFRLLVAASGKEALALAKQNQIDVAVSDIRMAEMNGIQLLEALKRNDPFIQVIMMTGYETVETACQALRLGACDYLVKPVPVQAIRESVANALARRIAGLRLRSVGSKLKAFQTELDSYRAKIEDARTQNEIYASIVHDLNGPLTIIAGFIDIIRSRIHQAHSVSGAELDALRDQLAKINQQIHSGVEISRRYLSFLRSKSALPNPVPLRQIFKDLKELIHCHPSCRNKGLEISPPPDMSIVPSINGTDLIQILLNLTINAFQSSEEPHSVDVRFRILEHPLRESEMENRPGAYFFRNDHFKNQPPMVAISVADSGQGIAAEMLPKVFEPYYSTKSPGQGTGLGLSIVKRLVTRAEGSMCFSSALGRGSTVTIFLPFTRQDPDSKSYGSLSG